MKLVKDMCIRQLFYTTIVNVFLAHHHKSSRTYNLGSLNLLLVIECGNKWLAYGYYG